MENVVWFARTGDRDLSGACRLLLNRALDGPARVEKLEGGRPWLPGRPELHISLSHTRGAVAAALSDAPVGVDLEPLGRRVNPRLAGRYFTPAERAYASDGRRLLEIWTRKEALLKRDGRGITLRLAGVEALERADILTREVEGFLVSFCGTPPAFRLVKTSL